MAIATQLPHRVRVIDHLWIELPDGIRLAARAWLPVDANASPAPALVEYLPYRKGDGTDAEDASRHAWFAGHGYASLRVDVRGSGDSDGLLTDEYSAAELTDGCEVIAWIARQPWCSGRVGLMGISWGGFNALQIAALAPPALRAVVSVCSTDDRYADDVHYMGGAVLARDMLGWATTLLSINARPPDPAVVGDTWRDAWRERVASTPAFIDTWLRHSTRDDYWRHGSVCENYAAIVAPVLVVGGWADGYTNAALRMLDGLRCEHRTIIGPWAHNWPHAASPGPRIGFLQECLRWWNRWLRDGPSGVADDPPLRVWMDAWYGGDAATTPYAVAIPAQHITMDLRHGEAAGAWCPFGAQDLALDQGSDDARATTVDFTIDHDITVLGRPRVDFTAIDPARRGHLVVRLCAVGENGKSRLISWGIGALANGRVELNTVGEYIGAGSTLRIAFARSYWPVIWPAMDTDPVDIDRIALILPQWQCASGVEFPPPETAPMGAVQVLQAATYEKRIGCGEFLQRFDGPRVCHTNGLIVQSMSEDLLTIDPVHVDSALAQCNRRIEMQGEDWTATIEVHGSMRVQGSDFLVAVRLTAALDEVAIGPPRHWQFRIPRPRE